MGNDGKRYKNKFIFPYIMSAYMFHLYTHIHSYIELYKRLSTYSGRYATEPPKEKSQKIKI